MSSLLQKEQQENVARWSDETVAIKQLKDCLKPVFWLNETTEDHSGLRWIKMLKTLGPGRSRIFKVLGNPV